MSHQRAMWGAERDVLAHAPALATRGVTMTLAAPASGEWLAQWRASGLPGTPLQLRRHRGLRDTSGDKRAQPRQLAGEGLTVARSAAHLVPLARRYDAVVSMSLDAHVEVVLAAALARRPSVVLLVDLVRPGFGRWLLDTACRRADLTIVNSTVTGATVPHARRVELVHPGVDVDAFTPGAPDPDVRRSLGAGEGDALVGIVGRLDEEKGVHVLLDAVRDLAVDRPLRVAVVGEPGVGPRAYARGLRAVGAALGDRVHFAGRRADMPDVLRALDVLVCASRNEPFGMSVLEAQACGVPVVATNAGGIPDFVTHGETGLLVPPEDVIALTDALRTVLLDRMLARRLAVGGRAQAVTRFDIRHQFDRYADLFRSLRKDKP